MFECFLVLLYSTIFYNKFAFTVVSKLERDIEMAKEYLDSLKAQPKTPKNPYTSTGKTYRNMDDSYSEAVEEYGYFMIL